MGRDHNNDCYTLGAALADKTKIVLKLNTGAAVLGHRIYCRT